MTIASRLSDALGVLAGRFRRRTEQTRALRGRGPVDHVVLLDGTMSSLRPDDETNVGLTYKLLREQVPAPDLSLYYEAGIQWQTWASTLDVLRGRGINRQIRRAYGVIASRYRPGDRIFLFGYSRGAYAVRSLAGVIEKVGLLRAEHATERNILFAYRHYRGDTRPDSAEAFRQRLCHAEVQIEMIGAWDTVKALGHPAPLLWVVTGRDQAFHSHHLGRSVRHGYHALAIDETRRMFAPVLWETQSDWPGLEIEQMWFRGAHGDVGGQLGGFHAARPLSNIPLVWMLEKAQACGLRLPTGWKRRFPTDPDAPMLGTAYKSGKLLIARRRRVVGLDSSEFIHATVGDRRSRSPARRATA